MSTELTCQELVELVTKYLDGALSAKQEARFEEHLATCDGCTTYLEQFRTTISLVGTLEPDAIGPRARQRLLRAFRDWNRAGAANH